MVNVIHTRIRELRKERGLTQEQLGKVLGVVKSTISLYESGKSTPDDEIKIKIADYFDVSLDYLLGRSNLKKCLKYSCLSSDKDEDLEEGGVFSEGAFHNRLTELELEMIRAYMSIPQNIRNNLVERFESFFASRSEESADRKLSDCIDKELERYRLELEAEQKGAMSRVSQDTEGNEGNGSSA